MSEKTFQIDVDGIGTFTCRRLTMPLQMRIDCEYSRRTEGVATPSPLLDLTATMAATLQVQVKSAPEGWDIDTMDPLDPDTWARLIAVYGRIMEEEHAVRGKAAGSEIVAGAAAVSDAAATVQA